MILAAIGLFTGQSRGQEQEQDRVNQLKAVYLYNYGNYVTWPDSSFDDRGGLQPFVIGILDTEHPVEAILEKIAQKRTIGNRSIRTILIKDVSSDWKCHILYVPETAARESVKTAVERVRTEPVLIVTEEAAFGAAGDSGMINFYLSGRAIKFQIDPKLILSREMKPSSKLIQLGTVVQRNVAATATVGTR